MSRAPLGRSFPRAAAELAAVLASGSALFLAAAAAEEALGASAAASALLEELGKAALILACGWAGGAAARRGASRSGAGGPRAERLARLGGSRGLSLGLAAAAAFAGAETLAYFAAFPEAGILRRFLWSMPVHLDAALLEALGCVPLLGIALPSRPRTAAAAAADLADAMGETASPRARLRMAARSLASIAARAGAFLSGLAAGAGLHAAANLTAEGDLGKAGLALGAIAGALCLAALARAFIDSAYIGGYLHGTD